ncbi:cyclin N-terminal domain-containing protein 1 [Chanos chanos]|uniref:Cyclin N-terminal domain-containing protein 1 n=1 Tax=Chanos chanos TaxID=29144 RepID=A0A6J2VG86_CHACN|nr:cyclin N-terminal domain-containing protein 1 [Chanos chanos]
MALFSSNERTKKLGFGQTPFEILSDFLAGLDKTNKSNLDNLSKCCGNFKEEKIIECVFLICKKLRLDPTVGYHATEILERFMTKHLERIYSSQNCQTLQGATCGQKTNYEDMVFEDVNEKFFVFILSSVQIASKLALHSSVIDNNAAMEFLHSVGRTCSKEKLMESELLILKTLDFNLNLPNPLSYVETLLEILGYNDPSVPVAHLHHLCRYTLQFIYLQRGPIYQSLLVVVTGCSSPPPEHRVKFVSVTEDCMLLGVAVIAVSAFIHNISTWEQVVAELNLITGISIRSIMDFAHVVLMHISGCPPCKHLNQ